MRLGILAGIFLVVAGIACAALTWQHQQTQWVRDYHEATDSFERAHYADAEAQLRLLLQHNKWTGEHKTALATNLLALVYHSQGRMREAEPLFEKAIAIFAKEGPPSQLDLAKASNNEGRMFLEENRLQDAEQRLQRALDIFQKQPAAAGPELGSALQNLGLVRRGQKRPSEAQALLEQAVRIYEQTLQATDLNLAQGYLDLAVQYRSEGLLKNAQETDQKVLAIQEYAFGSASPVVKETQARLALESVPAKQKK